MDHSVTDAAHNFGDWAYIGLAKHFRKMLKHEKGVLADQDPEALHQMRVGMRRLRSAIAGFGLALELPKTVSQSNIGKIAKVLGRLRDIDVLMMTLTQDYQPNLPVSEAKQLQKVLKWLRKRRKPCYQKVVATLQGQRYQQMCYDLSDWLAKPHYCAIAQLPIEMILPDLLAPHYSQFVLHPGWLIGVELQQEQLQVSDVRTADDLETLLAEQESCLHDLRKTAKKLRYQMELFEPFYRESYQMTLRDIRIIQSLLGSFQDAYILKTFLKQISRHNLTKTMPVFVGQINQHRLRLWQEWEKLQQQFLTVKTRQNYRHSFLLQSIPQTVHRPNSSELVISSVD